MELPPKSHCISQQGYHRPAQLHCGKRLEHHHRTPHVPAKLPTLPFPQILTAPLYPAVFLTSPSLAFPKCCIRNSSFLFPHIYCPHQFSGQQTTFSSAVDSTTDNVLDVINCFCYFYFWGLF